MKIKCDTCGKVMEEDMMVVTDHTVEHTKVDIYFRKEFGDSPIRLPIGFTRVSA